ncbi:MAG TPA: hypothetical protein PLK80_15180 [bacterium]|nr:MAG: hypothetical protein BWY28_02643 [bacterium ADurb.Bin236]HOY64351.1 hypothetical protein [bacterium]HPI78070.1 hypothetical protein [bacterium]HPN94466.1 hypothetical protein [bacterium]
MSGKKDRLLYPAQSLYVHDALPLSEVQVKLVEEFGSADGYVSNTTLAKWRRAGGWDEKREVLAEAEDIAALMESLEKRIIGVAERLAAAFGKLSAIANNKERGQG